MLTREHTVPQRFEHHLGPDLMLLVESQVTILNSEGPRLDPGWAYLDARGHRHTQKLGLCIWVEDVPAGIDGDGEEWNAEGHYECELCAEVITPGLIYGPYTDTVQGPHYATLRSSGQINMDVPLTPEQYEDIVNAEDPRAAARAALASGW